MTRFRIPAAVLAGVFLCTSSLLLLAQDNPKGGTPKAPPRKDKPEIDWSLFAVKLKGNKFAFHLQDLNGKPHSSREFFGNPLIVCVDSALGDVPGNTDAFRSLEKLVKRNASTGVKMLCIFLSTPELDNAQIKRLKDYVKNERLESILTLTGYEQVNKQFSEAPPAWPVFIFLNRDGSVESTNYGWAKGDEGEEGGAGEGLMTQRVKGLIAAMAAKPKPRGEAPEPPPFEEVKPLEGKKEPDRQAPTGSPE